MFRTLHIIYLIIVKHSTYIVINYLAFKSK